MSRRTRKHGGVHHLSRKRTQRKKAKAPETFEEILEEIAKIHDKIKSTTNPDTKRLYTIKKKILERKLQTFYNVSQHLEEELSI